HTPSATAREAPDTTDGRHSAAQRATSRIAPSTRGAHPRACRPPAGPSNTEAPFDRPARGCEATPGSGRARPGRAPPRRSERSVRQEVVSAYPLTANNLAVIG